MNLEEPGLCCARSATKVESNVRAVEVVVALGDFLITHLFPEAGWATKTCRGSYLDQRDLSLRPLANPLQWLLFPNAK